MHYNTRQYFAASVGIRKTETVARRFFVKKVSLEISQNSQGNTWARVSFLIKLQAFLIKLQASARTLLKKRPWRRCFPVNFAKILRTRVLTETSGGSLCGKQVSSMQKLMKNTCWYFR